MKGSVQIANARIVTAYAVVRGGLTVDRGVIQEVLPAGRAGSAAIDFDGDYLLPGLVELHTDNLERQFQPRPKVRWPAQAAMLAHDRQIAAAGITTVCDGVCVGIYGGKRERIEFLQTSLEALHEAQHNRSLTAEHFLHLRCEVSDPHVVEMFEPLLEEPTLKLVSLMDHTPGQRQWHDIDKYRTFHRGRTEASEEEFMALIERRIEEQKVYAKQHRRKLLALMRGRPITLASHDDTTALHVEEAAADGITISEFPTTHVAAKAAREQGLGVVMGAPNLVLGGSHSGNVSAQHLAEEGLLDALSSDYVPVSLLHGAFRLHRMLDMTLPQAIAPVSRNPAAMIGLDDRGVIAPGLRADLVRARLIGETPSVIAVWREGERVA
jgi:alpha-D-ribose 1-methylphosphonate 5-triphosphate diphosphatase